MSLRPNFFVGIRLPCPAFANAIVAIQNEVLTNAPNLANCRMDPKKLHLTTFVLCLQNQDQIDAAAECLWSCQDEVSNIIKAAEPKVVTFRSIGSFTRTVLYAEPLHDDVLAALVTIKAIIERNFMRAGLLATPPGDEDAIMTANSKWTPHATIMKLSYDRKNGRKLNIRREYFAGCDKHLIGSAPSTVAVAPSTPLSTTPIATKLPAVATVLPLPDTVGSIAPAADCVTPEDNPSGSHTDTGSTDHSIAPVLPNVGLQVPLTTIDLLSMQQVQADGYYRSYAHIHL